MQGREGLTVSGLAVERGGRLLLSGLEFMVPPGAALAITGENGTGKSTLLRTLAGLLAPARGRIALRLGREDADAAIGDSTHYLGHADGLKAALTAGANLRFRQAWGGGSGLPAAEALAAVGLPHCADIPVGLLSAGQKRRVALAALLVAARPLWLLDEPATALDAAAEALLVSLLRRHLAGGGLAVMALHGTLDLPAATLRLGPAARAVP